MVCIERQDGGLISYQEDQSLNNRSGFNAFPVGYRFYNGPFRDYTEFAGFWSSTDENNADNAWYRYVSESQIDLKRFSNKKEYGNSVRFVRDASTATTNK